MSCWGQIIRISDTGKWKKYERIEQKREPDMKWNKWRRGWELPYIHVPTHKGKDLNKAHTSNEFWKFDNGIVNIIQHIVDGANDQGERNIDTLMRRTLTFV